MITVYEISMQVFLLEDIKAEDQYTKIAAFIDNGLVSDPKLETFHKENKYKFYNFNLLYPLSRDGVYKKGGVYRFQIRTVDLKLARFFSEQLVNSFTDELKGLTAEIKMIPRHPIEKLYSLTPAIIKIEGEGYWKTAHSPEEFEKRLFENMVKKYNVLTGTKVEEDFTFHTSMEFLNHKPVAIKYKGIKLLGDKVELHIDQNNSAQELAYLSLGTGICEINARGAGFVNYKWV